ncbi:MAG: GHKL domain-containing protein [Eubacteriales bacterium]|nr:GHKL domain-containing protein [Eubacteriales bacterium]
MNDMLAFGGDTLIGALYASAFAALLIGYLWDFFRFSKPVIIAVVLGYCVICSVADQVTVFCHGISWQHQLCYLLTLFVIPYCGFFFLTRLSVVKYFYMLASVSIQAFYIVGLMEFLHIDNDNVMLLPTATGVVCAAGLAAIVLVILYIFRRFGAPLFRDYPETDVWGKLLPLSLGGALALGVFYFLTDFMVNGTNELFIFTACYIALFIADVVAMSGVRLSIRIATAEARLESADELLSSQKEQYKRLSDSIEQTRQARHDLHHHMNAISGFLMMNDLNGLHAYLKEYEATLPQSDDYVYTGNDTADIIVGHYLALARQQGIQTDFNVHIPESFCIRDTDLCVLVGNCLENAIEACKRLKSEKRFMRVESAVKGKYLAITIANSYNGSTAMQNGAYLSDKRQRASSGVGLESVKAVVRAYHGEMKVEESNGVFTVYAMMKMLDS